MVGGSHHRSIGSRAEMRLITPVQPVLRDAQYLGTLESI
jgi:hypothetical protein